MVGQSRSMVIQLLLVVDTASDWGRAARAAEVWFEQGWQDLGGETREVVERQWDGALDPHSAVGPFGFDVQFGFIQIDEVPVGGREFESSRQGWRDFLAALYELPVGGLSAQEIRMVESTHTRHLSAVNCWTSPYSLDIDSWRYGPHGQFLTLELIGQKATLFESVEREETALGFFPRMADLAGPVFGAIEPWYASAAGTALEYKLSKMPWDTVPHSREVLRGYSWVTVLTDEMAQRVGGIEALGRSGAFYQVDQLGSGGVWLRATERFSDYRHEQAERVFEVLRQLLPVGAMASAFINAWDPRHF